MNMSDYGAPALKVQSVLSRTDHQLVLCGWLIRTVPAVEVWLFSFVNLICLCIRERLCGSDGKSEAGKEGGKEGRTGGREERLGEEAVLAYYSCSLKDSYVSFTFFQSTHKIVN